MAVNKFNKYAVLGIIVLLGIFLIYALLPYMNAFFGALILFVLFRPFYDFLTNKLKWNRNLSAYLVIIITLLLVVVPAAFFISTTIIEVNNVAKNTEFSLDFVDSVDDMFPTLNIQDKLAEFTADAVNKISGLLLNAVQGVSRIIISMVIMYFILYFLLVEEEKAKKLVRSIIPFNKKNTARLLGEVENITYSTIITTGLIAIIQGSLITISFLIFGVNGAFFWGLVGIFVSFLPVVGTPLVWIPASVILAYNNDYVAAGGILLSGLFLSNVDNFLRPWIQKRVGKMHPLVSLIGIFIGISFFGLLGIVIGPLLLSVFLLMVKMFKEEYNYKIVKN